MHCVSSDESRLPNSLSRSREKGLEVKILQLFPCGPSHRVSSGTGMEKSRWCYSYPLELARAEELMKEFHQGLCIGHHVASTIAHTILISWYYWPSIFQDVHSFHPFQVFTGIQKLAAFSLHPIIIESPFRQCDLDFIGEFKENSSNGHKWILIATDYFTKWV